ncbi:hypothetical protein FN846DRAFT_943952, partial [Sphaerosporella brunnea]
MQVPFRTRLSTGFCSCIFLRNDLALSHCYVCLSLESVSVSTNTDDALGCSQSYNDYLSPSGTVGKSISFYVSAIYMLGIIRANCVCGETLLKLRFPELKQFRLPLGPAAIRNKYMLRISFSRWESALPRVAGCIYSPPEALQAKRCNPRAQPSSLRLMRRRGNQTVCGDCRSGYFPRWLPAEGVGD